jgi:hypothetical protein
MPGIECHEYHRLAFRLPSFTSRGLFPLRDRLSLALDGDTINFGLTGSITIGSQLTVNHSITVSGPGAQVLRIHGNNSSRVFNELGQPTLQIARQSKASF